MAALVSSAGCLLTIGAKRFDSAAGDVLFDDGEVAYRGDEASTVVGMACEAMLRIRDFPVERSLVEALVWRLVAAGADPSLPSGTRQLTPVTMAVRRGDLAAFEVLIATGATARDVDLVRPSTARTGRGELEAVKPLLEEAFDAGGEEFRAQVTEALMRHVMRSKPAPGAPAPHQRRSARTV